jgi:sulfur-oxidizing protein SoxX
MKTPPHALATPTRRWFASIGLLLASLGINGVCAAASDGVAPEGWRIMNERSLGNCIACHALPGQTGVRSTLGPSLLGVGARYSAAQLQQWVVDARQIQANTLMPPFGTASGLNRVSHAEPLLNPEQIRLVVTTLSQWR